MAKEKKVFVKIGVVTHYFSKKRVAAVKIDGHLVTSLLREDHIWVHGRRTSFGQLARSIEINCTPVERCKNGDEVGIAIKKPVRKNDVVYLETTPFYRTNPLDEILTLDAIKMRQVKRKLPSLETFVLMTEHTKDRILYKLRNITNY